MRSFILLASLAADGGEYNTIQAAIDALSSSSAAEQSIFIGAGTYSEQVYVPKLSGPLSIFGYTTDDSTYSKNVVIIKDAESQASKSNNDAAATLRVWTSNFKMHNVNVVNSYGKGSQALALSANALTASGRTSSSSASCFIINNSTVAAVSGSSVSKGAYYLGRPWSQYARVAFQSTDMTAVVNSARWAVWNSGDERTGSVDFGEYDNTGGGSTGTRASFSKKLSKPVAIADVLGSDYESASWVDMSYL